MASQNMYTNVVKVFDNNVGHHLTAMNVNGKIHIFEGHTRKKIVRCPDVPTAWELYKEEAHGWTIWVATSKGDVYRKLLSSTSVPAPSDQQLGETSKRSNHSIFDDLLNTQEPDFIAAPPYQIPDDVCELGEEDKVVSCGKRISCMGRASQLLALICEDDSESVLLVYSLNKGHGLDIAVKVPFTSCGMDTKARSRFSKLTVVTCEDSPCVSSSSLIRVPPHLFSMLFGWESSLRSFPIVVCSTSDGSIYFVPVNLSVAELQSPWQLLCRVDSTVVDLLSGKVNRALTEKESVAAELHGALGFSVPAPSHSMLDALVVVGASGKCCLMTAVPTLGSDALSTDFRKVVVVCALPGGVNSVCCRGSLLYTSSVSHQIEKCELSLVRQGEEEGKRYCVEVKAEVIFCAAVSAMWLAGEDSLVCQTSKGDIITIDSTVSEGGESTQSALQPSLKDLLLGVDLSHGSLQDLRSRHALYNAFLRQMNVAAHLLLQRRRNARPLDCSISVQSKTAYHEVKHFLSVEVRNRSSVTLTKDWSLVVVLREATRSYEHDSSQDSGCCEEDLSSSTHCFPLSQELGGNCSSAHFTIPVSYSPVSCGWTVEVSLALRMPEILQKTKVCDQDDCVFVSLGHSMVDVFHFLLPKQGAHCVPLPSPGQMCVESKVAELKRGAQTVEGLSDSKNSKAASQMYSVSTCVLASPHSGVPSSPVALLRHLLRDSQASERTVTHPSCTLQVPSGSTVTMVVETATASMPQPSSSSSSERAGTSAACAATANVPQPCHTVTIKSTSVSLLARARLALRRRLQVFDNADRDVSVEEVRKLMQRTETCQRQLQQIQDKWEKGENSAKGTLSDLCAMYETVQSDTFVNGS